jgi:O-antigen/teichoic acid export membrane protein
MGLPILVSISALRAGLTAADRFDLLNLVRIPSGIMSFAAPVLMIPFTHSLAWLIAALIVNRAISWLVYAIAIARALPDLRSNVRIDPACALPLLGFGAWITISSVIAPMILYLDRFLIGGMLSLGALAAYSIPMEIVSKSFILPAAISGVMFPAFARSFAAAPVSLRTLFGRSLKLVALCLFPACAAVVTFAPQIMSLWVGSQFAEHSSAVLQILAVGAFVTGLAWIPLALLHGAHRPDLPAKIHLVDFPIYALMLWVFIRHFGLAGAAVTWSARLLAENLIVFAMASRYLRVSRREMVYAFALLIATIVTMTAGAWVPDVRTKALFVCALSMSCVFCAWRFLLDETERARIVGLLPFVVRPALAKVVD